MVAGADSRRGVTVVILTHNMSENEDKLISSVEPYDVTARPAYLYLISDGELIKIGIARDVRHRIAELQIGNGRRLSGIEFDVQDALDMEQNLHKRYAKCKTRGEWFELTSADIADIYEFLGYHDMACRRRARDEAEKQKRLAEEQKQLDLERCETWIPPLLLMLTGLLLWFVLNASEGNLALPASQGLPQPAAVLNNAR